MSNNEPKVAQVWYYRKDNIVILFKDRIEMLKRTEDIRNLVCRGVLSNSPFILSIGDTQRPASEVNSWKDGIFETEYSSNLLRNRF